MRFHPNFQGVRFLGGAGGKLTPRGGFVGGPESWDVQQCQGPQTLEMGLAIILAIILAVLSQRLSGGGAGESPREKKKLQFAFGCLESGFLEGQLKSDRCLSQRLKRSPDRKATLRRVYHLEKRGRGGVFLVYMRFAMTPDSGSP